MYENNIKPAQFARLDSLDNPLWVSGMVSLIGNDSYFRWHDSGDVQSLAHLELIIDICKATPKTMHWLPTREYGIVKAYIAKHKALPDNLIIRLSAMYPDQPVKIPASLQNIKGITVSNVHAKQSPIGEPCKAPMQGGACNDCRACWTDSVISYGLH
jgi:hypothetical protein